MRLENLHLVQVYWKAEVNMRLQPLRTKGKKKIPIVAGGQSKSALVFNTVTQ